MNFVCISSDQYPDKYAAPIRHSTIMRGLVEQGHSVKFLLLSPQNWNSSNKLDYYGIQFETLNTYKGSNKILKKIYELIAIRKANKWIKKEAEKNNLDAVIIFTVEALPISLVMKKAHAAGVKVFHERTELPYASLLDYKKGESKLNFYLKNLLPQFDGVFVINDKLNNYIQQFNSNTQKLLTVVNLSFFKTNKPSPYPFKYVAYCGQIWGQKDGVPILIEAFAKISNLFPELKLVLVGDNSKKDLIKETTGAVAKLNIQDKVVFTGLVERDMMPVILCNAEILVVSKPDNERNSGNFPIKIGEYLATGVPVVVTKVGEIPAFIKDGESGFLATPGSADAFAGKMKEALADTQRAKTIGLKGRQVAESFFDYRIQAKVMEEYISKKIKEQ